MLKEEEKKKHREIKQKCLRPCLKKTVKGRFLNKKKKSAHTHTHRDSSREIEYINDTMKIRKAKAGQRTPRPVLSA